MGTKRRLAPTVRSLIASVSHRGQAADLFAGMGSVASALAPDRHVLVNDVSPYAVAVAKSTFLSRSGLPSRTLLASLKPDYDSALKSIRSRFADDIKAEDQAAALGHKSMSRHMVSHRHAGNDDEFMAQALEAKGSAGPPHYQLTSLYFMSAYFGARQAIQLDSLRFAIDKCRYREDHDWLVGLWLSTAATLVNAPGHTAQFLKPSNDQQLIRLRRLWARDVWDTFEGLAQQSEPHGSARWRQGNVVTQSDACAALRLPSFGAVRVVYADPPYTKDHYSRFYHVMDTLTLYDFPMATGAGRYRDNRHRGDFSLATKVQDAFNELAQAVAEAMIPLVVSYPADGLLHQHGGNLTGILARYFAVDRVLEVPLAHSTLGASTGSPRKAATERLYVCLPTVRGRGR